MSTSEPSLEGLQAVAYQIEETLKSLNQLVYVCDYYGMAHRNTDESIRLLDAALERVQTKISELQQASENQGGYAESW